MTQVPGGVPGSQSTLGGVQVSGGPSVVGTASLRWCRAVDADEGHNGFTGRVYITLRIGFFSFRIDGVFVLHNAEDLGVDHGVTAHCARGFIGLEIDAAMFVEEVEAEHGVLGEVEGDLGFEAIDATGLFEGVGVHAVFGREGAEWELDEGCAFLARFALGGGADGEDVRAGWASFGLF